MYFGLTQIYCWRTSWHSTEKNKTVHIWRILKEQEEACQQEVKYASYSHTKEGPYGLIPYIIFLKKPFVVYFQFEMSVCLN